MRGDIFSASISALALISGALLLPYSAIAEGPALTNPIIFVTTPPNPEDFGSMQATFGNHLSSLYAAPRGGDLWIRYSDGSLKNLTAAAGFGNSGFQGASSIAVRDPAVHWNGAKVIFSMIVGAPTRQYDYSGTYRWQLYEITGLGKNETPAITKVPNQPTEYNNVSPVYGSEEGVIFFITDRPRNGEAHLYPQRDEYESAPTNTGIWKLKVNSAALSILVHAPSGDFDPIIDSFGRIIFTQWDHLQRDQQNRVSQPYFEAFRFADESAGAARSEPQEDEIFPEVRDDDENIGRRANENNHSFNLFFPWQLNQDGTGHETLNHIGRHELAGYMERNFSDDPSLDDFYLQVPVFNHNRIEATHQIQEDPLRPGTYFGVNGPEFGSHASGQLVSLNGAPSDNPEEMAVTYITHPDTRYTTDSPSADHSGLYRDPLPLQGGEIICAHTQATSQDENTGSRTNPASKHAFRLKTLKAQGNYNVPDALLTGGITKSISFWDPDTLVQYDNVTMWETHPVELRARSAPTVTGGTLEAPESAVFEEEGVDPDELKAYMDENGIALISMRNVTTRDGGDFLQPLNLKVPGGAESSKDDGKVYEVSSLQLFQGDLLRGYGGMNDPDEGRRVLATPLHETVDFNVPNEDGPEGSVKIASDGSVAAFVPARRAMSWQLTDPQGGAVVRERYWVSFQPGEIRVCTSCHGINKADQQGNEAPVNSPEALRELLRLWKGQPYEKPSYDLKISAGKGKKLKARQQFNLQVTSNRPNKRLKIYAKIGERSCDTPLFEFDTDANGQAQLRGKFPPGSQGKEVLFDLRVVSSVAKAKVTLPGKPGAVPRGMCGKFAPRAR